MIPVEMAPIPMIEVTIGSVEGDLRDIGLNRFEVGENERV